MLRLLSIRGRLQFLSLLLISSLIVTNLVLIDQTRRQAELIARQADDFDVIVQADAAVQTFGNLKYWLTDLALSQLTLSDQKAKSARNKLDGLLNQLAADMPEAVAGLSGQLDLLVDNATDAADAYANRNRLVGNAMMSRGRANILAVDSRLTSLVAQLRAQAQQTVSRALAQNDQSARLSLYLVGFVTLAAALLTVLIVKSVVSPLRELVGAINAMTGGRMDTPIPTTGRDEISAMAKVLTLFRDSVVRRERAERAEARLWEVINNVSEGFALFDSDDRLVLSNRAYRERVHSTQLPDELEQRIRSGASFEEILRANAATGQIREAKGREEEWIAERLAHHRAPAGLIEQQRLDGTWMQINEHKTTDGGTVAFYTDITPLKEREAALRHQALIIEQLYDAVVVVDLEERITGWNQAAERIFGYTKEEMLGRTTDPLYVDDLQAEALRAEMARQIERTDRWVGECANRRKDGSLVQLESLVFRLHDEQGEIVSTIGVNRDITERKRTEQALEESRRTLRAIIDAVPATISVKNRDGRFTLVNPAQADLYGLKPEDMVGQRHAAVIGEAYSAIAGRRDAEVLATGRALAPFEESVSYLGGQPTTWTTTKIPLFDADDKVSGVLSVAHDITARKQVEIDLRRAKEEAELATRTKSQFLANMSHELRTPMNAIIGFTRLVQRQGRAVLPERQLANLEKILISADHLLSLINSVLDLSKIEAGQMELNLAPVDLGAVIDQSLRTVEPMMAGKTLSLRQDLGNDLPTLVTDGEKLTQILINLLSNAVKFTDQGSIQISLRHRAGGVAIAVADSGVGIPESEQARIFEQFHQADGSMTRRFGGTGLGLSISRHLARLLGGEITVESRPGQGSTFTLWLAARDDDPGAPGSRA